MKFHQISFDVWNTLITPNPAYALGRMDLVSYYLRISPELGNRAYRMVKHDLDKLAMTHGISLDPHLAWFQVFRQVSELDPKWDIDHFDHEEMSRRLVYLTTELFEQYPPFISEGNIWGINELRSRGMILHIASNTNFIGGDIITAALEQSFPKFDSYTFSDKIHCSKPSATFFQRVKFEVLTSEPEVAWPTEFFWHVGDDANYDIGVESVGGKYWQVQNADIVPFVEEVIRETK